MPACGSEKACLQGHWPSKAEVALNVARCRQSIRKHQQRRQPNNLARNLISGALRLGYRLVTYSVLAPALWISAWFWLFWLMFVRLPLGLIRLAFGPVIAGLTATIGLGLPSAGGGGSGNGAAARRCVLVSGGSSVQTVQLARHLSRAGARVIVCELEGLFGLARFSRACARYYTLPRPRNGAAHYVSALKEIVRRERVTNYLPVSVSSPAYFDGLAKPHLELMGCECFAPAAAEASLLEDPLELIRWARLIGLPTPEYHLFTDGLADAVRLYGPNDAAAPLLRGRYLARAAGPTGMRPRPSELKLPARLAELTAILASGTGSVGAWVVLRDPGGTHFVTCTAVRDSRLIANVTCRVDEARGGRLVPERRSEVDRWLVRFLARGFAAKLNGHLSFRLAASTEKPDELVALGCRVGLGPAYLGHEGSNAAMLLSRPCPHKSQVEMDDDVLLDRPLNERDALFLYSDPLPYCVYCCLKMPIGRVVDLLQAQRTHKPPLAVVK